MPSSAPIRSNSVWTPLAFPIYRVMWIAMVVSNIGTWMNEVGVTWMMASLAPSNLMIALIQTAATLPFLLVGYPAGALGDTVNRRTLLVVLHLWMLATAVWLSLLTHLELTTEWLLLIATFALGIGNAMLRPPWAANIPSYVPREQLSNAVTLNTLSTNMSKAIGPALGGIVIASWGALPVFIINAVSFVFVLVALLVWHPKLPTLNSVLPVERFVSALKAGLRYTLHEPDLKVVLIRSAACFFFASAFWSLIAVILIRDLNASASTYGLLMAVSGLGAVLGAMWLPGLGLRYSRNLQFGAATGLYALALLALSATTNFWLIGILTLLIGIAWIVLFSSMTVTAQLTVPDWVRARALSIVMLNYGGCTAVGSALWGYLSDVTSVAASIYCAVIGLLATLLLSKLFPIASEQKNIPSVTRTGIEPESSIQIAHTRGPVMVTVQYVIPNHNQPDFLDGMQKIRRTRRRNGAFFWEIFQDAIKPDQFTETFLVESWLEYLRQRERMTDSDMALEKIIAELNSPTHKPAMKHYVAPTRARG